MNAETSTLINTVWVLTATILVLLMQGGFAMLEAGFSRGKNVGAVVSKVLANMGISLIIFWAVGFAIAFGQGNPVIGTSGFFLQEPSLSTFASLDYSNVPIDGKFLFQAAFCSVSLAIVWGAMLDRTRFRVYVIFAVIYAALIYPMVAHSVWGGGLLSELGAQDFAGSSVVHLSGAAAALAGTLVLGPRIGKFAASGKAQQLPGHSMPLAVLGALLIFVGFFGFNAGSFLAADVRIVDVAMNTALAAAAGVIGAMIISTGVLRTVDVGLTGNGALAGLVAITAPCAFVEPWAAIVIGLIGGCVMVGVVLLIERIRIDDPLGAIAAHGSAGIWGTLACGLFSTGALAELTGFGRAGLFYGGGLHQLGVQAITVVAIAGFVFISTWTLFKVVDRVVGLRVGALEEIEGLDIHEHGQWGYPEQFTTASVTTSTDSPKSG